MSEAVAPALDAPDLPMSDYRALREGREVVKPAIEGVKEPEPKPAAQPPAAPGESGADSGTANVEGQDESASDDGKQADDKQQDKPGSKPKGLVDEVIKLRRENRELKSRVTPPPQEQPKPAGAPAEAARAAATPGSGIDPAKLGPDGRPDINKYTDYTEFNRDTVRSEILIAQREQAAEAQRREAETAQRQKAATWQTRVSAAAAKPELVNFEAIAFNTTLQVTPVMGDAITDSELGPEILYHLGLNPAEAERISKLAPVSQIREIGKLEASLAKPAVDSGAASDDEPASPQKSAISKAPSPIPRPAGSVSKPNPAKNIEGMSQAEYRALREAGRL